MVTPSLVADRCNHFSPLSLASLHAPSYFAIAVLPPVGLKNRNQPAHYHLPSHNIPNFIHHHPYPIAPPPFDPRLTLDPADLHPSTHPCGHGVHKYDTKPNASLCKQLVAELDMTPRGVQVRPSPSRPLGVPSADQQFDVSRPPFFNATSESACHIPVDLTDDMLLVCVCRSVNGSTMEIALSSMRCSIVCDVSTGSTASSIDPSSGAGIPQAAQRLSVDLARPLSILSSSSSLRPPSTISGISVDLTRCSARSSSSSVVSHDRRKECKEKEEGKKTSHESRRSSESHRHMPISEFFPEMQVSAQRQSTGLPSPPGSLVDHPMVRIEEATADGHSLPTDNEKVDDCWAGESASCFGADVA
ncbi:hypothetical protein BD309DRAFT_1061412 [Dichomitus squalens]|nr:hypothetical protein BD309DRAFT_1061412 [Dichomitus squalens]